MAFIDEYALWAPWGMANAVILLDGMSRTSQSRAIKNRRKSVRRSERRRMAIRRLLLAVVMVVWVPLLAACGGGGGSSPTPNCNAAVTPITVNYPNPSTLPSQNPSGTQWQITGVSTTLTGNACESSPHYDYLTVNVTFSQDVYAALPAPGTKLSQPGQLGVSIGINSDKNFSTGNFGGCNTRNVFPNDYASDAGFSGRSGDGTYAVFAPPNAFGSTAQASAQGKTFSETFFLSSIGSDTVHPSFYIDVGAVNGSGTTGVSCAPANAEFSISTQQLVSY